MNRRYNSVIGFSALCMGFFMVILDVTIINVTLPTIAKYFHTNMSALQWVVDGYTLMFAGLLLLVGSLTDCFGAKRIFQIGLIAFALTSLGCALSSSINELIVFRLLQGSSGSLLLPPSLALINNIYSESAQRARAIGTWAAVGGIACALGPFLGGLIISFISWRAIFFINIVIGFVGYFIIRTHIKQNNNTLKNIKFDWLGQIVGFISIFALTYGLIEASLYSFKNLIIIVCFIVSAISFLIFIVIELQARYPIIPLKIFRNRIILMALITAMVLNLCFYGILFTMPFYFENERNYTAFITGLALLPLPILAVVGSYLGGKFTAKIGAGKIIFIGLIIAGLGFLSLLIIQQKTPDYIWIMIPFLAIGFGVSFTTPAMTFAAIHSADESRVGIVSAVLNTISQIGSLIGVAVFGAIITMSSTLISGMHITLIIAGFLFLITSVLSILIM